MAGGRGRATRGPCTALRSTWSPIAPTWLGATARVLETDCILPEELRRDGWLGNSLRMAWMCTAIRPENAR